MNFSIHTVASVAFGQVWFGLLCLLGSPAVAGEAPGATQISLNVPVENFRLPTFTPDGHRAWLIRGSQAILRAQNLIDVSELALTIFSGDATDRIQTLILSPVAQVSPSDQVAQGKAAIRLINDSYEAAGRGWRYAHREKTVSLHRSVRVTIHSELKDLLK